MPATTAAVAMARSYSKLSLQWFAELGSATLTRRCRRPGVDHDAVPPEAAGLAQAVGVELGAQDPVEGEPRQGVARLAREQIGAARGGPDLEQFFRGDLVG